jgi:hypothetical protein
VILALLAVLAALAAIPGTRDAALRVTGRGLVAHDELAHADVIVIANDADGAGALEAADLVHEGFASRVAVFGRPESIAARAFARRGIPYQDSAATAMDELRALGVKAVERIPQPVAGTNDEGEALPGWCRRKRYHVVIFVSSSDHSRRTRRVLHRDLRGTPTRIIVWYSHYSSFEPDAWWRTRNGARIAIVEYEKLLLDILRHPLD